MFMLVLTALGWRLPMRAHLGLQTFLVALWMHLGVGPHSRSKVRAEDMLVKGTAANKGPSTGAAQHMALRRPSTIAPRCPALAPRVQLCTSPEVAAGISAVYQLGELAVAVLLPFAARPPTGKPCSLDW